jgi:hypothetical protein
MKPQPITTYNPSFGIYIKTKQTAYGHCDIGKYNQRFGQNFPNDKRQLKNSSVTLKIIDRYCDNLDMEAILTIRDREPGVPNPINRPISISLTTGEFINMNFDEDDIIEDDDTEDNYDGSSVEDDY